MAAWTRYVQEGGKGEEPKTISDLLIFVPDPIAREELEAFRIEYEKTHGPTDLTRRYTSTWPKREREWLQDNNFQAYFDGLPPYAKALLEKRMQEAANEGRLDDLPDRFVKLHTTRTKNNRSSDGGPMNTP